jgi:short-subunit dehydrogenase
MQHGTNRGLDMTAQAVADLTLRALAGGKSLVVTGWKNKLIVFMGRLVPIVVVTRIGAMLLRKMRLEVLKGGAHGSIR